MLHKILEIFKAFTIGVSNEDGELVTVLGPGLTRVYVHPEERLVAIWRGDTEICNECCSTDSILLLWCEKTAKEIGNV